MSLSRAKNIFKPANINSIVFEFYVTLAGLELQNPFPFYRKIGFETGISRKMKRENTMEKRLRVFRAHSRIPAELELHDPFLAQRTINSCCKWPESTCAVIQCGQLRHPIYPTVPPTPYFFLYEFLLDTI